MDQIFLFQSYLDIFSEFIIQDLYVGRKSSVVLGERYDFESWLILNLPGEGESEIVNNDAFASFEEGVWRHDIWLLYFKEGSVSGEAIYFLNVLIVLVFVEFGDKAHEIIVQIGWVSKKIRL